MAIWRIGLTGGIGSGKSEVSRILARLGAPVIDADAVTRRLEARGEEGWARLKREFGWPLLDAGGELMRRKLARAAFRDPKTLTRLNALIHPLVRGEMEREVARLEADGMPVVILDIPLLIETGVERVDEVWVVYSTPDQQMARIMGRDRVGREAALERMRAQIPLDQKLRYADRVIDNTGSRRALKQEVRRLWQDVIRRAGSVD